MCGSFCFFFFGQVPFVFRVISWAWKWGSKIQTTQSPSLVKILHATHQLFRNWKSTSLLFASDSVSTSFLWQPLTKVTSASFITNGHTERVFGWDFVAHKNALHFLTYLKKREFLKWTEQQVHSFYCPIKTLHFLTSSLCNFFLSLAKQFLYGEINKSGR